MRDIDVDRDVGDWKCHRHIYDVRDADGISGGNNEIGAAGDLDTWQARTRLAAAKEVRFHGADTITAVANRKTVVVAGFAQIGINNAIPAVQCTKTRRTITLVAALNGTQSAASTPARSNAIVAFFPLCDINRSITAIGAKTVAWAISAVFPKFTAAIVANGNGSEVDAPAVNGSCIGPRVNDVERPITRHRFSVKPTEVTGAIHCQSEVVVAIDAI